MNGKSLRSLNESVSRILFEEDGKSSQQKKIGTYRTRFFHLCPGAQQVFPEIEDEIGGKDAGALAQMADKIFQIEDTVLKAGEPNEQASSSAREVYGQLMKAARKFGVDEKLDFMQGHLDIIDKGSKDEEDEEKPGMRGMGGFAGEMGGSLDGGSVDGGMGDGGAMGESYIMEKLDPVGKEDGDVDNDDDKDETDKYLKNRRDAIGKAIAKKKGKKTVKERKSQIIGSLLSEGKKKVNEDMDMYHIQQPDKRYTSSVDKDDPTKIAYTSADTEGARRFSPSQAYAMVQGGKVRGDARSMVKADPDTQADFHQHLDDSGVLLAKDHAKHGIKGFDMMDDEKNAYAFSSSEHDQLSDPHKFHDMENQGVSAVGFMPKGGLDLDPQKVRAERMMTSDHQRVMDMHKIKERGNANESYTPKDLREATMNRIKKVSSNIGHNSNPAMDRLRGI
tara:strand:- start:933 stop:2276 length:1344 start_codon:yes stop_codon:yes gene_type:complete